MKVALISLLAAGALLAAAAFANELRQSEFRIRIWVVE